MTQLIRTLSPALRALFDSGRKLMVKDLFTIITPGGLAFQWTDADVPIAIGADTWTTGPGIKRSLMTWSWGIQGSSIDVDVFDRFPNGQTVNGAPLIPWILRGGLDGASVTLHQAYSAGPGEPWVDKLHNFAGDVSNVQTSGRYGVQINARSFTEVFNRPLPPTVYQVKCRTRLGSDLCGIDKAAITVAGTATSTTNPLRLVFSHGLAAAAGYFDLGVIKFTSGANNGVTRTVRSYTSGQFTLMQPLPAAVAIGDTFQVYPGCNLTLEECTTKFTNRLRFRGTPFVPPPDTVT